MTNPHLVQLRARVDAHFERAVERSPDQFRCAAGCGACCHKRFSVFEVEAQPIREALRAMAATDPALREQIRAQAREPASNEATCPMLVDERCTVYAVRPIICRSHGLPVLTESGDEAEITWCPLNFTGGDPPMSSVLRLEAVNAPLAMLAELEAPRQPRVALTTLAAADDG